MIDYDKLLTDSIKSVKPSGIRKFFDLLQGMDDVISLSVGQPDFDTPWHIRKAGIDSLNDGKTYYTSNAGLDELRGEISNYLFRRFNIPKYEKKEILITVGGSEAIDLCIRSLVNPGEEVIVPEPSFVCYSPLASLTGGVAVPICTKAEDEFRLTADALKAAITPKTKLLVLPFPNNPTGAIMQREDLEAIADVLDGTDIMVLSDEIYAELTYGNVSHCSCAAIERLRERTVLVGGFSKAYAMTGWRLGYACGPAPVIAAMLKLHQFAIMCAPTTSQYAAVKAMRDGDGDVDMMVEEYDRRRKMLIHELNRIGMPCFDAKGAFYLFPSIQKFGLSSEEFAERLLNAEHVAVVPGSAFGESGEGFVRICYAHSLAKLTEAVIRIERFLKTL